MPYSFPTFDRILIIDDDESVRFYVGTVLQRQGYRVETASSGRAGLEMVSTFGPDLILMDVVMPGMDGFETFDKLRRDPGVPHVPVIFVTAVDDPRTIYQVFDYGDTDYVGKPIRENELIARVKLYLELRRRTVENEERLREILQLREHLLSGKLNKPEVFKPILTRSPGMFSIFQYMESIAVTSWPVLITGETGTGKELVAQAIHDLSGRKARYVTVNVAGLDDNMFADTLFGHTRGAFTGAEADRSGLIERASRGTLFLDEIGDLEPTSQVKLLRLLQQREYYPLGSDVRKVTDARIIVATNRSIEEQVSKGTFREDLYFRLRTHHVHLPPLRERPEDIPILLEHFIAEASRQLGRQAPTYTQELVDLLHAYDFLGNVRELESMVIDAVSRSAGDELDIDLFRRAIGDVSPIRRRPAEAPAVASHSLEDTLATVDDSRFPSLRAVTDLVIQTALERTDGNQTAAAKLLGISRQALNKRLRRADDDD